MAEMMQAAVYHGPHDLRVENVPIPGISAGEILIRVEDASICGTDLRIYTGGHRKYPAGTVRVPGHEVVGRIAAFGLGVAGYAVGQRVFVAPNMGCGHCRQCVAGKNNLCADYDAVGVTLDGGFAEFMRVPARAVLQGNVLPVGEDIDPAEGALIEPFACVLRGQMALGIRPGDLVLVMGAGPIGIMHMKLARLSGAGRVMVSEPVDLRREQAARLGADRVIDPGNENLAKVVAEESHGDGMEVIIVAAPAHAAQEQALQLAAIGGRINFFGGLPKDRPNIQFDSNMVHYKELMITGTTACSTGDCLRAAEIVNTGKIDLSGLISRRFGLAQAVEAFHIAGERSSLKIILEP